MKLRLAALLLCASAVSAHAQDKVTAKSLLDQEFQVVGVVPSKDGPGVFMQKKSQLFFCLVVETPTSPDVATRYCKPVR